MKSVASSYAPTDPRIAGSGATGKLEILRALASNNDFLYGVKGMFGGWGIDRWNSGNAQFTEYPWAVTGNAGQSRFVGRMRLPTSLNGTRTVWLLCDATGSGGRLRFVSADGEQVVTADVPWGGTPVSLSLASGVWSIFLESIPGAPGSSVTLRGIQVWHDRREVVSGRASWQGLHADRIEADGAGSSHWIQAAICNQHNVIGEYGSLAFSRSMVLPWTNANTLPNLARYDFFVEEGVAEVMVYVYARVAEDTGDLRVHVNGALQSSITLTTGFQWRSVTVSVAPGWNFLEIKGRKLTGVGSGDGVQLAAVCAWEMPVGGFALAVPSVSVDFQGIDRGRLMGPFPALAQMDGAHEAGFRVAVEDTTWLKSVRRRMLVCDYLHRTAGAAGYTPDGSDFNGQQTWVNGISRFQTSFDVNTPFRRIGNEGIGYVTGSVVARFMAPASVPSRRIEVWCDVRVDRYLDDREPDEFRLRAVAGASISEEVSTASSDRRWVGPMIVDRASSGDTEVVVQARCVPRALATRGLVVHGMVFRDVPLTSGTEIA